MATVVRCVTSGSDTSGFVHMSRDIPEGIARANLLSLVLSFFFVVH